jgi:hypothetical protein
MRLYTFGNFYLSSIQQGIQAAHLIADMFVDHQVPSTERTVLYDWAKNHKTLISLNGGNHADLTEKFLLLRRLGAELQLPVGSFQEDDISLNRAMTCCGIVVPQHIYDFAAIRVHVLQPDQDPNIPVYEHYGLDFHENTLAELIKSCSLAR